MSVLQGRAKKYDGSKIDYVSIFNWVDGKCIAQITPDASGAWEYEYFDVINIGITYVADGCEPITHGAYNFTGWTPATLFDDNQYGVWFDPSDISTLFQDVAGTIPVTTDGQPVALMLDKSGNDFHAKQTNNSYRPLYKTNGNLHWLQFDGSNDHLIIANPIPIISRDRAFFAGVKGRTITDSGSFLVASYGSHEHIFTSLHVGFWPYGEEYASWYADRSVSKTLYNKFAGYSRTLGSIYKNSTGKIILSADGENLSTTEVIKSDRDFRVNDGFIIGGATLSLTDKRFFNGDVYGLSFILKDLDSEDVSQMNQYLARKTGATLV